MITVRLPAALQPGLGETIVVAEPVRTLGDLVGAIEKRIPGFRDQLEDSVFNFAVNDEMVLYHARDRLLADGDRVELVPAISGG
jgi:molybdopterin converting factor small subunit